LAAVARGGVPLERLAAAQVRPLHPCVTPGHGIGLRADELEVAARERSAVERDRHRRAVGVGDGHIERRRVRDIRGCVGR
jgi:hypothetical protein